MMPTFSSLLVFFCLVWQSAYSQSLTFLSEKIEITIHGQHAVVYGQYHFQNNAKLEIKRNLFYPFAISKNLLYPDTVSIIRVADRMIIPFVKQKAGVDFSITVPPESSLIYEVFYSQRTLVPKLEYILTTAQRWKKPLNFAEYVIILPHSLSLKYLSLNISEIEVDDDYNTYKIIKFNYIPQTNLIVEWERRTE